MRYFDHKNNRLVITGSRATSDFWDNLWQDQNLEKTIRNNRDWLVAPLTKKYIPPQKSKKILEGGCGKGQYVYSLDKSGYDAYGIDSAEKTIEKVKNIFPQLKISVGDVEKLEFPDEYFDGYWSLGVIEHFYEGYEKTAAEMQRVIKQGGFLFIAFPQVSLLRRLKSGLGGYEKFDKNIFNQDAFYEFALDEKEVREYFENNGFTLRKRIHLDGLKGLKDEILFLKPTLQKFYDNKNKFVTLLRAVISRILAPISGHSILLIFTKK